MTSNGAIQANSVGIYARSRDGAVTVDSTGDVTSYNAGGIFAFNYGAGAGDVKVYNRGGSAIQARSDGIFARSRDGAVTVDSTGDVTSDVSRGIYAGNYGAGAGDVSVKSVGGLNGIQASSYGIFARSSTGSSTGAVTVDSTGDVTSQMADAIRVSYGSSMGVTLNGGTIYGANDGVEFRAGMTNSLKNYASISGGTLAVHGGTGDETINNYNLITGNVDLGAGTNAFFNRASWHLPLRCRRQPRRRHAHQ